MLSRFQRVPEFDVKVCLEVPKVKILFNWKFRVPLHVQTMHFFDNELSRQAYCYGSSTVIRSGLEKLTSLCLPLPSGFRVVKITL